MNPYPESFDQPTQEGKPAGKKLTPRQRASIFAGIGGAAALGTIGTALAWGMSQDGFVNDKHPSPTPGSSTTPTEPKVNLTPDENKPDSQDHKPTSEHPTTPSAPAEGKSHQNANTTTTHNPVDEKPADNHPDSHTPHTPTSTPELNDTTDHEPTLATHVNDDMTKEDAFKAAREEVGAGGFFEWHGELYNTFYKEEWEGMSAEQRQAYIDQIYDDDQDTHRDYSTPSDSTIHEATTPHNTTINDQPDIVVGQFEGHTVGLGDTDHDGDAEIIVIDDGTVGAVDTDNDGIMDTRVELNAETHQVVSSSPLTSTFEAPSMNALDTDTTHSTDNDQNHLTTNTDTSDEPEVVVASVDDHQVLLTDVDNDGYVDVMLADNGVMFVDTDGDHKFDLGMIYNSETGDLEQVGTLNQEVDVPHFDHVDNHVDNNLADNQDYDNNSDVSEWA